MFFNWLSSINIRLKKPLDKLKFISQVFTIDIFHLFHRWHMLLSAPVYVWVVKIMFLIKIKFISSERFKGVYIRTRSKTSTLFWTAVVLNKSKNCTQFSLENCWFFINKILHNQDQLHFLCNHHKLPMQPLWKSLNNYNN